MWLKQLKEKIVEWKSLGQQLVTELSLKSVTMRKPHQPTPAKLLIAIDEQKKNRVKSLVGSVIWAGRVQNSAQASKDEIVPSLIRGSSILILPSSKQV